MDGRKKTTLLLLDVVASMPTYLITMSPFCSAKSNRMYELVSCETKEKKHALRGNRTPGGSMATTQVTTTPLVRRRVSSYAIQTAVNANSVVVLIFTANHLRFIKIECS